MLSSCRLLRAQLQQQQQAGGGSANGGGLTGSERVDIVQRIEDFLSSELHTYVCPICFELMAPPERPPMLLFPCGHSFCRRCLDKPRPSSNRCPYCREVRDPSDQTEDRTMPHVG